MNPAPIARPSTTLGSSAFRDAKASARATIAQLVTMRGIKIPRDRSSAGNQAWNTNSMHVTRLEMISTYIGIRISVRMNARVKETKAFESVSTASVASPNPKPLMKVLVTASSGQSPSN